MTTVAGRMYTHDGYGERADEAAWRRAFEEAWPTVEHRLRQVLRARAVPRSEREDYLQEVAARAVASRVPFHDAADLLPWASTVLRRLHAENARRAERLRAAEGRLSVGRAPDTATRVVAKLDLDRIAETVSSWSPFDRAALLGAQAEERDRPSTPETGASYVRRHRLRAKLLTAIDGLAGAIGGIRRLHVLRAPEVSQAASALVAPVAMACAALALPLLPFGGDARSGPSNHLAALDTETAATVGDRVITVQTAAAVSDHPSRPYAAADVTTGGRPAHQPHGNETRPIRSPVEHRVEVLSGDNTSYVEVENNEKPEPLYCMWVAGMSDETCVDQPGGTIVSPVPLPW